ncbi:methionine--tRNA ligase [uncultured Cytophaga sp.]|uniref:methionine--tRNA ligase n=1 Tax=uncultured Cytophaga sp. TaxID=160238 RepID=UPI00262D434C|nr:methionine--tRNA ligase [uncultured Cytophaga sp.]
MQFNPIRIMTNKPSRYTITSALPYANGPVHIGHLAGVYVPADIYARFLRSKGENVLFIGGSDEHGVPITIRAKKEGVTPQQIVDKYHIQIKQSFEELGISFDIYSRTSSKIHAETSSEFFVKLYNEGKFIEQTSEQYYDPKAEQFLADRYIIGTCPKCGNENAYGDQCEKCGSTLSPSELINPRSTLSGEKPVMKSTKHWFLPLDTYEPWLKQWILEDHKNWKTNVYGQCKSWLDQGLQPRAVTRDLDWGVPVPVAGAEGKVLYVWFDAPIGYISAAKDYFKNSEIKAIHKQNTWEDFWKKDDTKLVHFIGKDNIVFHCIIFPAMLKAEGSFILPDNVPANEFMNLEGDKISTSRNWAVWLHEYLEEFKDKQDVLRYALCANAPETKDNDFTWRDFQARNNNELVAVYGNFVNRAMVLSHKYYEGIIPALGTLEATDEAAILMLKEFPSKIAASIEQYRFREALGFMMDLARLGNKYLADTEPWKIYKENPERVKTILHIGLQIAANLAIVSEPFIPFTSAKLFTMLNLNANTWNNAGTIDLLKAGDTLNPAELLFEKIEDATIEAQVKKLEDTKQANILANAEVKPLKENVSFDDFAKMDIRVATIIAAEKVAKTKKLLKLTLNTGIDERTVVSGIAEHFAPEDIIGQQVSLLANLAPREIKGIVSQGMILMAEDADGKLKFVQPGSAVSAGSIVG